MIGNIIENHQHKSLWRILWQEDIYIKPYWLMPIRFLLVLCDVLIAIATMQIRLPGRKLPSLDYLVDMVKPVMVILQENNYNDFAIDLANAPFTSQSVFECAGETREVAKAILQQPWSRQLGIRKDLKQIIKFCQRVLNSYD